MSRSNNAIVLAVLGFLCVSSCGPPPACQALRSCGPARFFVETYWDVPPAVSAGEALVEVVPAGRVSATLANSETEYMGGFGNIEWTTACVRYEKTSLLKFRINRVVAGTLPVPLPASEFYVLAETSSCAVDDFRLPAGQETGLLVVYSEEPLVSPETLASRRPRAGDRWLLGPDDDAPYAPVLAIRRP